MKLYIAGVRAKWEVIQEVGMPYTLGSFYRLRGRPDIMQEAQRECDSFMLDSGAFSFQNDKDSVNWDEYTEKYAEFISEYNVDLFFEMDIDQNVGLERVGEYRDMIEQKAGKPTIPVFHKSRGKEKWFELLEEYDYVAIGGMAGNEMWRRGHKYLRWFIRTAHERDVKIHGLGFTRPNKLPRGEFDFDSVDSTTWVNGSKFGEVYHWNPVKKQLETEQRKNQKMKYDWKTIDKHSLREWKKFVKYLEETYEN